MWCERGLTKLILLAPVPTVAYGEKSALYDVVSIDASVCANAIDA